MKTEAQIRHEAAKQGYALQKSRSRYSVNNLGGYRLLDLTTNFVVAGERFDLLSEDVEKFLSEK